MKDLVSICIPCHNGALYINETLISLTKQTYKNIEIIIVDDHSTDNSYTIIQDFIKTDGRISVKKAIKTGASAARNQAYKSSSGSYIIFFDADDLIPENFIETQILCLKNERDVVVAKWGRFFGNDLTTLSIDETQVKRDMTFEKWIISYWSVNNNMTCPGRVFVPKVLIDQSNPWDETLTVNDDFTFYTAIFANSNSIRFNNKSTFFYRSGINGLSSRKGNQARLSLYKSVCDSIAIAKSVLESNDKLNKSYANLLQSCIYEFYPSERDIIVELEKQILMFGGSDFKHPAGGKTKFFNKLIGWKKVAMLKNLFWPH